MSFKTRVDRPSFNQELDNNTQTSPELSTDTKATKDASGKKIEDLFSANKLASFNFPKITKAIENLSDANTGEKIDFNSLEELVQKDLLDFLGTELMAHQKEFKNANLDFLNVKIEYRANYIIASSEFIDENGEKVNLMKDFLKNLNLSQGDLKKLDEHYARVYSRPLGDKDAQRPLEELAKDYVEGKEDNYFGFLKNYRGKEQPKLESADLIWLDWDYFENQAKAELQNDKLTNSEKSDKNTEHSEFFKEYKSKLQSLFNAFLREFNKRTLNYSQIYAIKNNPIKDESILTKALNL